MINNTDGDDNSSVNSSDNTSSASNNTSNNTANNTIELYLPWPVSVNNYYSHTSRGVYVSKRGKQYQADVISAVNEQMSSLGKSFESITYKVQIELILYAPDKRKRDLDNHLKSLQDSITQSGLWEDDSLIDQLYVNRGIIVKKGLALIRISPAESVLPLLMP